MSYVGEPPPQASSLKLTKPEVAVEIDGLRRDGVDNYGASTELAATSHAAGKRVEEQVAAEGLSLLGAIEGEAGEQHDGNGVRHPAAQPRGRLLVSNGTHRQGVVADDSLAATQQICRRGPARRGDSRRVAQPAIERLHPAGEVIQPMRLRERFDGAKRTGAQRAGIGLCLRA